MQCKSILSAHGRHWRCERQAAAKWGHKVCGKCAGMMPLHCRVAAFDGKEFHSAACKFTNAACDIVTAR